MPRTRKATFPNFMFISALLEEKKTTCNLTRANYWLTGQLASTYLTTSSCKKVEVSNPFVSCSYLPTFSSKKVEVSNPLVSCSYLPTFSSKEVEVSNPLVSCSCLPTFSSKEEEISYQAACCTNSTYQPLPARRRSLTDQAASCKYLYQPLPARRSRSDLSVS
jgi:hypothetical protein